jgi:uncharacterized protein
MISMAWEDLLFLHWPVAPESLRPLIPAGLELDLFDGVAWLAVVPFRMRDTRLRWLPGMPGAATFPELNVRTYVRGGDLPGVWFFSLDAASTLAVKTARRFFHLPYHRADMRADSVGETVCYSSRRSGADEGFAEFEGDYGPTGPVTLARPGTLEHWLTERYRLFAADTRGRIWRGEIRHEPWPLQPAKARVRTNTLLAALGLGLPSGEPLQHFARRVDVRAWMITEVGPRR